MNIRNENTGTTFSVLLALVKGGKVWAVKEFDNKGTYYRIKRRQYERLGYKVEEYDLRTRDKVERCG